MAKAQKAQAVRTEPYPELAAPRERLDSEPFHCRFLG
jgi:hypothetical protein